MAEAATIEFFARLAYASELLAPGADMDAAPPYDALPLSEKQRLREAAREAVESVAIEANDTAPAHGVVSGDDKGERT